MQIRLKSLSLMTAILLTGFGCGGDNNTTSKNIAEFDNAKKLISSLNSQHGASTQANTDDSNYEIESENFTIDPGYDYHQTPMIIDSQGNLQKGGMFKFIDEKDRQVIIEATDTNVVVIKIDLNHDGLFTEDEIIVEKFDPSLGGGSGSDSRPKTVDDIISSDLKKTLNLQPGAEGYVNEDEKIEVVILLGIDEPVFPSESHSSSQSTQSGSSGSVHVSDGTITYYYNGKEVTKEFMDEVQRKQIEEMNRQNAIRDKLKRETLEAFIKKNNLTKDEYINQALENSRDSFVIALTKDEIRDIAKTNLKTIIAIEQKQIPRTE